MNDDESYELTDTERKDKNNKLFNSKNVCDNELNFFKLHILFEKYLEFMLSD